MSNYRNEEHFIRHYHDAKLSHHCFDCTYIRRNCRSCGKEIANDIACQIQCLGQVRDTECSRQIVTSVCDSDSIICPINRQSDGQNNIRQGQEGWFLHQLFAKIMIWNTCHLKKHSHWYNEIRLTFKDMLKSTTSLFSFSPCSHFYIIMGALILFHDLNLKYIWSWK